MKHKVVKAPDGIPFGAFANWGIQFPEWRDASKRFFQQLPKSFLVDTKSSSKPA